MEAEDPGGEAGHLADRLVEAYDPLLPGVEAEHPGEGAVEPGVGRGHVPREDAVGVVDHAVRAHGDPGPPHEEVDVLVALVEVDEAEASPELPRRHL